MPIKSLYIIALLFVFTFSNLFADIVHLKNGSVVKGQIVEQTPNKSIKIKTADGSMMVYTLEEIDRIEYEKASSGKSPAVALILSLLVWPGAGDFYVGKNTNGIIYTCLGVAGLGLMIHGASQEDEWSYSNYTYSIEEKGVGEYWAGFAVFVAAKVASCVTAYKGAKNYGQAGVLDLQRDNYSITFMPGQIRIDQQSIKPALVSMTF